MLQDLSNPEKFQEVRRRLILIAGFKFRIRECDAEDIAQTALAAYCEHRQRYKAESNQMGILVGIFKKKCLEFIDQSTRTTQRLQKLAQETATDSDSPLHPERGGTALPVIDQVIRREDADRIGEALRELNPRARELFELLVEEDVGRRGLIERLRLKPNTLDSRIRSARIELRDLLKARGICI
jgi:RNA polymerase sigma factor (sigma-70 family)